MRLNRADPDTRHPSSNDDADEGGEDWEELPWGPAQEAWLRVNGGHGICDHCGGYLPAEKTSAGPYEYHRTCPAVPKRGLKFL
jgi:hypothetical protein